MKPEDPVIPPAPSTTDLPFRVFDTLSDEEKQEALQRAEKIPDHPQKLFYGTRVQERLLEQSKQMMQYVEKKILTKSETF